MPPIACLGSSVGGYAGSSLTFAVPADTRANDVLVVALAGPTAVATVAPTGWELLATNSAGAPASRTAVFRRLATADEPAVHTFAVGAVAPEACGVLALLRQSDPSASMIASGQQAVASVTTTHTAPAITLFRYSDALLLVYYAIDGAGTATLTPPSGATKLGTEAHGASGSGGGSLALCLQLREQSGPSGTQVGTWSAAATGLAAAYAIQAVPTQTAGALDDLVPGAIGLPMIGV